jgi:hypothetical protein
MKIGVGLPPGWSVIGTIFTGALLWIGAQLPAWLAWGFTVLTALVPDVSVAPVVEPPPPVQ